VPRSNAGGAPIVMLRPDDAHAVPFEPAVEALLAGRLVIYPTDTLYALGGRALDPAAAEKVQQAKGRPETKPLPLIACDRTQAEMLVSRWPPVAEALARAFWPGPLTLVLPARPGLPGPVTSAGAGVAVRVPALRLARELCRRAGPLISTSANRSGEPGAVTCAEAIAAVGEFAAVAIDLGPGQPLASTIVDLTGDEPRCLREGAIAWAAVYGSWTRP